MPADLLHDGVMQRFYPQYRESSMYQDYPMELLGVDPTIGPLDPESCWPLGRARRMQCCPACWRTACAVCGKGAAGLSALPHLPRRAGTGTVVL